MSRSGPPGWHRSRPCSKTTACSSFPARRAPSSRITLVRVLPPVPAYPGLIVKDSYWRWPERDQAGNAIDFFMRVLGLSFHDAMRQITGQ